MPYTIVDSNTTYCTRHPQQTRIFRNPRGLQYRYAVVTTDTGIKLYKSETGETWTYVADLLSLTDWDEAHRCVASVELYDDGTQLIVYVALGHAIVTVELWVQPLFYRRLRIADDQSNPIIGALQTVPLLMDQNDCAPVIKRDRNGYVHIAFGRKRFITIKGLGYRYAEPYIVGTTTTNPDDAPSWCTEQQIDANPDITYNAYYSKSSLVVFGGTGDIGGVVYVIRNDETTIYLKGCDIVSYSPYVLGTPVVIDVLPSETYINTTNYPTHEGFKMVVDDNDYAHIIYRSDTANERLRHRKANASNTVESWQAYTIVDGSNNEVWAHALVLTLNKSVTPNDLYAFYVFRSVETNYIRYRSTPIDTISWSSEVIVSDDTTQIIDFNVAYRDYVNALHLLYKYYGTPHTARYYELLIVVPIPPPKYSFTIPLRYIKMTTLIKRNGEIIGYRTPYTPYRTERPIQPEIV